jgi:glycosyltransferase involved in cell wall biosynthesis
MDGARPMISARAPGERPETILLVHDFYQKRGGEDAVVEDLKAMLEARGHTVETFFVYNNEIEHYSMLDKALVLPRTLYNPRPLRHLSRRLAAKKIDLVHIHNIWPLISPSLFFLLNRQRVPYLQTIHNYRYVVANAMLYKGDVDPANRKIKMARRKGNNYRNSYLLTLTYWLTARFVRFSGVIDKGCGALQLLGPFGHAVHRQIFDPDKLVVLGNFLPDKRVREMAPLPKENYYLFLGRLSEEKGVFTLLKAFCAIESDAMLKIAGTGPMEAELKKRFAGHPRVQFVGFVTGREKDALIAKAKAMVVPSEWQEVFPVSVMEANFAATPVIAARIGGLPDMVAKERNGLFFESGDVVDLSSKLEWCETNPDKVTEMGTVARQYAEEHFSEEQYYRQLTRIYRRLIDDVRQK